MIIEYELQGSTQLHKGVFDTTGFWARFEPEYCDSELKSLDGSRPIEGYKILSYSGFAFYHADKEIVLRVWNELIKCLRAPGDYFGMVEIGGIGLMCKV